MTYDEMASALSDHGFDDASVARIQEKINSAYWDLCGRMPWPFLEKVALLDFDDDTASSHGGMTSDEWPTDFRANLNMVITTGDGTGTALKRIRPDVFLQRYASDLTATGVPQVYYILGGQAYFYPAPADTTNTQITMFYLQQPPELSSGDDETDIVVPAAWHQVIVDGALFKLYAMEDDTDIAPTFEAYFERGIQNMIEYCWHQSYDGNDIVHPVDSDDLGQDLGFFGTWSN